MRWRCHLIRLALVALTWVIYYQVWEFDFIQFDDDAYVFENQQVLGGLTVDNLRWAWSREGSTNTGSWHPVTWMSLMLDGQFYGSNAGGYHLTNVLFHTAGVLLLFAALRRMTDDVWKSAFVAALFAVHPLHVESAVWISERKDVLYAFFGLMSLWAYACYARQPTAKWYLLSLTAFVMSLLSKQMLVTLPFLLLLLDYWPLRRVAWAANTAETSEETPGMTEPASHASGHSPTALSNSICPQRNWSRLVWEKLPFFLVAVGFCMIALAAQQQAEALTSLERLSLGGRISNALVVYVIYIGMNVWPTDLAVFYPYPEHIPSLDVSGSAILLIAVTLLAIYQARSRAYLLVGWFWYLGTLVPVTGIVKAGAPQMADRFTYFPGIGLFIAATWLAPTIVPGEFWRRRLVPCIGCLVLLAFTAVAWRQTSYWRDSITLFERTLAITDRNDLIHNNLGVVMQKQNKLDEAIDHYQMAVNIEPLHVMAHYNLANVLNARGHFKEAIQHFQEVLNLDPEHLIAYNNLGHLLCEQGLYDEAVRSLRKAVSIDAQYASAHANLGLALFGQGRFDQAIRHFRTAETINPEFSVTDEGLASRHVQVGEILAARGNLLKATVQFRQALRRKPDYSEALYDLALAQMSLGKLDEARQLYTRVLADRPDFAEAHNELGEILLLQGDREQAGEQFRKALLHRPGFKRAEQNLTRLRE